jgi:hypothetical protein
MNSSSANEFTVRASGGIRFFTDPYATAGVKLGPGATAWSTVSDRNAKKNIGPLDGREILAKLGKVPVQTWNYRWESDDATPNLGPMAQDFKRAFFPGRDDKTITTLEFDGVELGAIAGLKQLDEEKELRLARLERENAAISERNAALESRVAALERLISRMTEAVGASQSGGSLAATARR